MLEDQYVVVAVDPPKPGSGHPRGRIVEVLGDPSVPGVDVEVVLRHFKIPDAFPPAVLDAVAGPAGGPDARALAGTGGPARDAHGDDRRRAARGTSTTRSSVSKLDGDRFRLGVHIADVGHYVAEDSALDREAYRRGTSVYYPDRAVPMLPERLSNGLCSLRPQVPRLALSAFLESTGKARSGRGGSPRR